MKTMRFMLLLVFMSLGPVTLTIYGIQAIVEGNWVIFILALSVLLMGLLTTFLIYKNMGPSLVFVLFLAHFVVVTALLLPGLLHDSGGNHSNWSLALVQLILFLGIGSGLLKSRVALGLSVLITLGFLFFLFFEPFNSLYSSTQKMSLGYFFLCGVIIAFLLQYILGTLKNSLEKEKRYKTILIETNELQQLHFSRIGHDIRSPLSAVISSLELLRETHLTPEQENWVNLMDKANKMIMQDIDTYIKMNKEPNFLSGRESVGLEEFSREIVDIFIPQTKRKDLELKRVVTDGGLDQVTIPQKAIRHVLMNLLHNAVKFTSTGEVKLEVYADDTNLVFIVSDTGPGIEASEKSSVDKGFGLGLKIAKETVEILDGRFEMASSSSGTLFTITFSLQSLAVSTSSQID